MTRTSGASVSGVGCGQWAGTCSLDFGEAGVADGDELAAAAALSPGVAAGEVGVAGEVGAVGVVGDSCFWTAGGSLAAGAGTTGSGGGTGFGAVRGGGGNLVAAGKGVVNALVGTKGELRGETTAATLQTANSSSSSSSHRDAATAMAIGAVPTCSGSATTLADMLSGPEGDCAVDLKSKCQGSLYVGPSKNQYLISSNRHFD